MSMLRWGVLGTAAINEKLIPAIRNTGGLVAAVAGRSPDRTRAFAGRWDIPVACDNYQALLDSGMVDVVYIPLPNSLHAHWTIQSIKSGLPVLCEKPLTLNAKEARAVEAASQQSGIPVMEAFMYGFHPAYQRLAEIIAEGRVGQVRALNANFSFYLDEPDTIVEKPELGGGALLDVGCYCVDFFRRVVGQQPHHVQATATFNKVDRTLAATLTWNNGIVATMTTSIDAAERHVASVQGTQATVSLSTPWHTSGRVDLLLDRHGQPVEVIQTDGPSSYETMCRHFAGVVTRSESPVRTLGDSIQNMTILDALAESARQGRTIEL